MPFTTLISTAALAARLDDPAFAIVDCRFTLSDTSWGLHEYRAGHVPGAAYADLDRDLSGPKTGRNGRHPLPDPKTLTAAFGALGITSGVQVIAYDQENGMYASRLWWLLRWLGHESVAVLDGGFAKWTAERRPARSGDEHRAQATFAARPRNDMWIGIGDVARLRTDPAWRLVDARAPERYRGEQETIDPVAGHIPGAANHWFLTNLDDDATMKSPEELRAIFSQELGAVPPDRVISYCGSGVTACHNLLALEHAGIHGAKLYPGSWSEWCADPVRPVATNT